MNGVKQCQRLKIQTIGFWTTKTIAYYQTASERFKKGQMERKALDSIFCRQNSVLIV